MGVSTQQQPVVAPSVPSIEDMVFCHLVPPWDETTGMRALCGATPGDFQESVTCDGTYAGEAICPGCGHPTCPRCAVLSDIEERLL